MSWYAVKINQPINQSVLYIRPCISRNAMSFCKDVCLTFQAECFFIAVNLMLTIYLHLFKKELSQAKLSNLPFLCSLWPFIKELNLACNNECDIHVYNKSKLILIGSSICDLNAEWLESSYIFGRKTPRLAPNKNWRTEIVGWGSRERHSGPNIVWDYWQNNHSPWIMIISVDTASHVQL